MHSCEGGIEFRAQREFWGATPVNRPAILKGVHKLCTAIGVGQVDGCAGYVTMSDGTKACFIVLPTDGPDPDLDRYRRHETAHCNGWPANHLDK